MIELNENELKKVEGGIFQFVIAAIVGGIVYDVAKSVYTAALEGYVEACKEGVYQGIPSGR
jgi:lactobin A/cerein 7B family class IIb bacteriocin